MTQLGSGNGTSYPTAIDTRTTEINSPAAGRTKARAEVANDILAAVVALETAVGANPVKLVSQYASLTAAVASIGSTSTTLVVDAATTITGATTVPTTLSVVCRTPGVITKSSGTLTINGPFSAGLYQVFSGFSAGDVAFGSAIHDIPPEWWGAKGDGATDSSTALDAWFAVVAAGGRRGVLTGTYITDGLSTNMVNGWGVTIEGTSPNGAQLKLKSGANTDVLAINKGQTDPNIWPRAWKLSNLLIDGNSANNTSGNGIYIFQVDGIVLDNVAISDCAGYCFYADSVLGIKQHGSNIWGNITDTSKGSGGIYLKNTQYNTFNGVLPAQFMGTSTPAITLEGTSAGSGQMTVTFNDLDIEGSKNAIKVVDSGSPVGMLININNSQIWGPTGGVTAFDIDGDSRTIVSVRGGALFGEWTDNIKTTATSTSVEFFNFDGVTNNNGYQQDKSGVTKFNAAAIYQNLIPNGDFEVWQGTWGVPLGPFTFEVTGTTYSRDTVNYKFGTSALKFITTTTAAYVQYTLSARELSSVKGNVLHASAWSKSTTTNASYVSIVTAGGAAPSVSSDVNDSTDWTHLHTALEIPTATTAVYIRAYAGVGKTVTLDGFSASINCDLPFQPKSLPVFNGVPVVATASLPAADASNDGSIIIEDGGTGDRNIIVYAGGQRFRIDGGTAF